MSIVASGSDSSAPQGPPGSGWPTPTVATGRAGGQLDIWTDQAGNRCVLHLRGRLCAETVEILDRHVDRLGCRWCDEVVVDLRSLTLMDAVGARLLVGIRHYVAGRGGRFHVRGAGPEMGALLESAEAELGS